MIRASGYGAGRNLWKGIGLAVLLWVLVLALGVAPAAAAPKAEPWSFWAANDPAGKVRLDHYPVKSIRDIKISPGIFNLSSIYDWFQADFGGGEAGVLGHLRKYAEPVLAERLKYFKGGTSYDYDWRINEP